MCAGPVVRVLLVEDEVRLAEAIQRGLGTEGFQVELVHEGDDNIVEVYVGYQRKKIDAPSGLHSIETVRGAGYRLSGECGKR